MERDQARTAGPVCGMNGAKLKSCPDVSAVTRKRDRFGERATRDERWLVEGERLNSRRTARAQRH
jgi:hypothetical protein